VLPSLVINPNFDRPPLFFSPRPFPLIAPPSLSAFRRPLPFWRGSCFLTPFVCSMESLFFHIYLPFRVPPLLAVRKIPTRCHLAVLCLSLDRFPLDARQPVLLRFFLSLPCASCSLIGPTEGLRLFLRSSLILSCPHPYVSGFGIFLTLPHPPQLFSVLPVCHSKCRVRESVISTLSW